MRLLLDCDVLLDVLLAREPHLEESAEVLDWAEAHPGSVAVAWHTLANLHYLSSDGARGFIRELLEFARVPRTGTAEMVEALELPLADLEDAMQVAAAGSFGAQVIVTRNLRDFRDSPIQALSPPDVLPLLQ